MEETRVTQRIPSLDGLRAMCILVVLIGHFELCLELGWSSSTSAFFHVGKFAVRMFLAISGYLITKPLLEELARTQTINLRRYYIRRTLRVFPAYYFFLAIMAVATLVGFVALPWRELIIAATYLTDYLGRGWPVGHTWSLAVQEQFYVFWPLLLLFLGRGRALWFAAALLIVAPISRTLFLPGGPYLETRFDAYADSLAVGCLLAAVRHRMLEWRWLNKLMSTTAGIAVPVALSIVIQWMDRRPSLVAPWVLNLFLLSVQNVFVIIIIHWSMLNAETAVGRFLNSRPMMFFGAISYSVYLWQQPFLNPRVESMFTRFPLNLIGLFACALVTYYLIELPSFALRRRLEAWASKTPKKPRQGALSQPALES